MTTEIATKSKAAQLQLPLMSMEWDCDGADTQYGTHGIHTYLAAMIPQLARRLVETYVPPKGSVLDPFCGGGAVLVEAICAGRSALGCDINPLALLISKAKTTQMDEQHVRQILTDVLHEAASYRGEPLQFRKSDYIDFWFKPYMMWPLTALRYAVDEVTAADPSLHTLFKAIFSATVRDVSLTHRNEIRLRRMSESEQARFNPDVFETFQRRALLATARVAELPRRCSAFVQEGSATVLNLRNGEVTTVVCSPPYGDERNGVPYTQFAKNMLLWLGYTTEALKDSKRRSLGWHKDNKLAPDSPTLAKALDRISTYQDSLKEAVAFYADYQVALGELARVASQRVIIVIGQRVLRDVVFDNGAITIELMSHLGIPLEAVGARRLPTKRLPKMREFGAAISRENILVFRQ